MDDQDRFFAAVARRRLVRPAVRAIVRSARGFLVQRPTDNAECNYAFIGGEYELGDDFLGRLRKEFEEETDAMVVAAEYRFVVENRFIAGGQRIQTLEHYFEVELDRLDVRSREPALEQMWIPEPAFGSADVRPHLVRDVLLTDGWRDIRHLRVTG